MNAKRILAVLAAAALIVAAILIRNGLDEDDGGEAGDDRGGRIEVVCSTEFRAVCDGLDAKLYDTRTEPAENTYLQLTSAEPDVPDAWITLDPFPGMVDALLQSRGEQPLGVMTNIVATDTPQLAVAATLADAARQLCGGDVTWSCVSANVGDPLGSATVELGFPNPQTEAAGLLAFANAVAGYFDNPVLSTADWTDGAFSSWLRSLKTKSTITDAPLTTVITRKSQVNVGATSRSETAASAQPSAFVAADVAPAIALAANVALFGDSARDLPARVAASLVQSQWSAAAAPTSSLDAGTFIALQRLWKG